MKRAAVIFTLLSRSIWSQPAISTPQIGFVQDSANALRRLSGVPGGFWLGDAIRAGVTSSAFSGTLGMAKTKGALYVFDAGGRILFKAQAKPGAALIALADSGDSALAYLASDGVLLRWTGGKLMNVPLDAPAIGGEVISIAQPSGTLASMLVERDSRVWLLTLSLESGSIDSQRLLPGVAAQVLLLNNGDLVSANGKGITLARANGVDIHFDAALSTSVAIRRSGAGWVQVSDSSGRQFALSLQAGHERLYQLPEERP